MTLNPVCFLFLSLCDNMVSGETWCVSGPSNTTSSAPSEADSLLPRATPAQSRPSENTLLPAAAVVAAVCCVCLLVGLSIAFFVWIIMTMIISYPSTETKCGKLHNLWQYCATVLIMMPLAAVTVNIIALCTRTAGLTVIPGVISLAVSIWGILTWQVRFSLTSSSLSLACHRRSIPFASSAFAILVYRRNTSDFVSRAGLGECDAVYWHLYPNLLILFKIYVVINSLYFLIFICVIVRLLLACPRCWPQ